MGFGRLLALIIGLAAVSFAVKYALEGTTHPDPAAPSAPRQQLDNVRAKSHDLERQMQNAADHAGQTEP